MAEVGCVYDATPVPRAPADNLAATDRRPRHPTPKASGKWSVASVVEELFCDREGRLITHTTPASATCDS
jgi:hypothetical protein